MSVLDLETDLRSLGLFLCSVSDGSCHKATPHTKLTEHRKQVSLMPMALIDLAISVAFYDVHSYSGPILISPGPQGEPEI